MRYSEKKKRERNNLQILAQWWNMTSEERNHEMMDEAEEKFFESGRRVERQCADENNYYEFMSQGTGVEAIEYLQA